MYLGCAVRDGATLGVQHLLSALLVDCGVREAEVRDFECEAVVQQQVLRLEVSVAQALRVAVADRVNQLVEIGPRQQLAECAGVEDEVEQLAAQRQVQHDQHHGVRRAVLLRVRHAVVHITHRQHVQVLDHTQRVDFPLDGLNGRGVRSGQRGQAEDLERHAGGGSGGVVQTQLDLGEAAATQRLQHLIVLQHAREGKGRRDGHEEERGGRGWTGGEWG